MEYPYFKTREEVVAAGVRVAADVKLTDLEPYLERAEQLHVLAALGPATLAEVHATEPAQLLRLLRTFLATYAVRAYASLTTRTITSTGQAPPTGSKDSANTDKLNAQHLAALDASAGEGLEVILQHLEQNPAQFATWHASTYCTAYPYRYFQTVEQLREYPNAPQLRLWFRRAQGALHALVAGRLLHVIGQELHARLLTELDNEAHREVLVLIRTALAIYLCTSDRDEMHAADCALVALRQLLQRSPDEYPEFLSSPSYVPTDIGPRTTANAFIALW